MKLATWNVNSIRAREERLIAFLDRHAPDLVCLQELKTTTEDFPYEAVERAGYVAAVYGQKTYNGVAILSKKPLDEVLVGWPNGPEEAQARLIAATWEEIRVVCVYVPNGKTVGSESWAYKLDWLKRLKTYLARKEWAGMPKVVCGDFNVAPSDEDAAFPAIWAESVLCHPEGRSAYTALANGWVDVVRRHQDAPGPYTWWDYRQLAFPKGDGLRIDHILAAPDLADRSTGAWVDREERKGHKPSDHAPVLCTFDLG
jgi:exodeoxyribonuclease-3